MQNYYRTPLDGKFIGNQQREPMNEIQVRADIIGELDAINQYQKQIIETDNTILKRTLSDIKKEEEVHVGELMALLFYINPNTKTQFEQGILEFESLTKN